MRILLLNPNTSRAMTAKIAAAAREVAGPGVEIDAVCPEVGPAAVETHLDEVRAALAVVELIEADLATGGSDAYVIACFGDPGLDAARVLVDVPVLGIAEAAMHVAAMAGRRFGIVTTLGRTLGRARDLVARYGMESACGSYAAIEIPVLELEETSAATLAAIEQECSVAVAAPSGEAVDAIVLGCAGMADLCDVLTPRLGVPVVDGVAAAVGLAAGMVRMGIRTSQRGEYAAPAGARKHERNPAPVTSESSRGEAAPWQTTR
ncbi:aspartate/glutamate racemase family protein [Microbacterium dextranolyticum]|uniref:Asp/Glu racemase n=1 Tax=Microbacterium dextranolyticum TaxID=36806 RepID=A0A9W6HMN2_9MICO|nr:aspartate/glutamate racemase family protein [Microbacterium dextranolyticum]MBM7464398.1 allantoin racemase [Microbacterium dextranolyticum]GLJ95395.1 Asp/Glu racemase [Microbacterium dextranolyticum]